MSLNPRKTLCIAKDKRIAPTINADDTDGIYLCLHSDLNRFVHVLGMQDMVHPVLPELLQGVCPSFSLFTVEAFSRSTLSCSPTIWLQIASSSTTKDDVTLTSG